MAFWPSIHTLMLLRFALIFAFLQSSFALQPTQQKPLPAHSSLENTLGPNEDSARRNGPQIFNAINNAMRQWGSSVHHNGMSFVLATIPKNTQLYHGTSQKEARKGMEWLAFEIESAEQFAHSARGRPPPEEGHRGRKYDHSDRLLDYSTDAGQWDYAGADEESPHAYLHEYRTTRELTRVLYIDGMAAAKSALGPLDSQDLLLRDNVSNATDGRAGGDYTRAADLCSLGANWNIEGFIRMEPGFELIMCDFENGLELVTANQRGRLEQVPIAESDEIRRLELWRGVAARYHSIGNNRVRLEFSSFHSAFFYSLNLTNPDASKAVLPRLTNSSPQELARVKMDLQAMLFRTAPASIDWQGVTDLITSRYSDRLQLLVAPETTKAIFASEVEFLVTHFIDYAKVDIPAASKACSLHYLRFVEPQTIQDQLIFAALHTVSQRICSTLFTVRHLLLDPEAKLDSAKQLVSKLIAALDWSTWLECGRCAYNEVCYIAIWPSGKPEDHFKPACLKAEDFRDRRGYWGDFP